ncbi:MAG TPA: GNAT family N-acetyltransferase [Bryobacteraceae bacterium]|nr:GNAT family N-acetyltransferase [Bryobacteraceae bacterium]
MAATDPPLVRSAKAEDAEAILSLVDALADYEHLDRPSTEAHARLRKDLFGPKPRVECTLAEVDGAAVGYAFTFETYSSFLALPTLYLEDLFVLPDYRGRGAGAALFGHVLDEARQRGCGRMEWTVLDWNQLAIDFYKRFGAEHMSDWHLYRIKL